MMWEPKPDAPDTFSLKNAMAAMIAGTEADWLTEWMFWIPDAWFDTADFCAAGPPPSPDGINLLDLLSAAVAGRSTASWALLAASLMPKLQAIANDRVFSTYCQLPALAGTGAYCLLIETHWTMTGDWQSSPSAVDPGANDVGVPVTGGHRYQFTSTAPGGLADILWCNEAGGVVAAVTYHSASGSELGVAPTGATRVRMQFHSYPGTPVAMTTRIDYECGAPAETRDPVPQPEPPGAPPAIQYQPYDTIPDLGRELDRQEAKLDLILAGVRFLAAFTVTPTGRVGLGVPAGPDDQVDVAGAAAVRITIANIPAAVSETFENPTLFANLGHMTVWTADGALETRKLEHNPQVFLLPAQATHVTVAPRKPATAVVEMLYPTK